MNLDPLSLSIVLKVGSKLTTLFRACVTGAPVRREMVASETGSIDEPRRRELGKADMAEVFDCGRAPDGLA